MKEYLLKFECSCGKVFDVRLALWKVGRGIAHALTIFARQ